MAIAKDITVKANNGFCDEVYNTLSEMKRTVMDLQNRAPKEDEMAAQMSFSRHLCEIADEIDWKLQILSHSCPYEWTGSVDYESSVQVDEADRNKEFSPGYLGG